MKNKTTHTGVKERKEEIMARLNEIEEDIAYDVSTFTDKLNPLKAVSGFVSNAVFKPKTRDLATMGINMGVDLVVSRLLFRRGGIIGKVIVPFVLKNTLKNAINNNRENIVEGFLKWVIRKTEVKPEKIENQVRVIHVSETHNGHINIEKERLRTLDLSS